MKKTCKKVAFHNLGCKVNSYELDVMRQILQEEGYEEVSFHEAADIYIVNTCTVTNIADRKSRQMLHRAKKQNPDAVVVAVGCYVETDPARVEQDDAIDLVIGNNRKSQVGTILSGFLAGRETADGPIRESAQLMQKAAPAQEKPAFRSTETRQPKQMQKAAPAQEKPAFREDLAGAPAFESMRLENPGHTRAYIKIQDGCNQFCSYCIIPFARGRIRSRNPEEVLEEVTDLAGSGIREIVLTGIHISSYGLDFGAEGTVRFEPERSGAALLDLIARLSALDGIERIRLGSLEPRIMTEPFIKALSGMGKVCPHFHLSLQSGCDETLRRMNRHYTTGEYARSVALLRRYYDRPAITTDVIVGFPGETEAEFAQTCSFLEEIGFYEIHVFRYSKRSGTAAAKMEFQIPEPVKAVRSSRLLALTADQARAYREQFAGEKETILLEEICEKDGHMYWTGSTARYVTGAVPVEIPGTKDPGGSVHSPEDSHAEPPGTERSGERFASGMLLPGTMTAREVELSRGTCLEFVPV